MITVPKLSPVSFMLTPAEHAEVSRQLHGYCESVPIFQSMLAGISLRITLGCSQEGVASLENRRAVNVSVRFDSGYNFVFARQSEANAPDAVVKIKMLQQPGSSHVLYEHSLMLINWALRDLANGLSTDVVDNINRICGEIAEKVVGDKDNTTDVLVTLTYLMNGLREVRTGLDRYDLNGQPRQSGGDLIGALVSRFHHQKIMKAAMAMFTPTK